MATKTKAPKMTQAEAGHFDRFSVANATTVTHALQCGCEPYQDVFTYRRWQGLGFQVIKGQKAIKIPVIVRTRDDDTGEEKRLFRTSAVFCRHQVESAPAS